MHVCEYRCLQSLEEGAEALVGVSSQMQVLRIQLRSSARTVQAPNWSHLFTAPLPQL